MAESFPTTNSSPRASKGVGLVDSYAPAPDLKLRRMAADGETWTSIAEANEPGCGGGRCRRVVFRRHGLDAAAATGSQAEATGLAWF